MLEKLKNIFLNKEKRVENLISFLIILVITLVIINRILNQEENQNNNEILKNETNVEFATNDYKESDDLEKKLESILSKIDGVGKVSVLITYSESNTIIPIYNLNNNKSVEEETDTNGVKKVTQTEESQKEVIKDNNSEVVTQKVIMPQIQGAIITATGAGNSVVKSNIISAVEAVTGIAVHKIQVFEMGDE